MGEIRTTKIGITNRHYLGRKTLAGGNSTGNDELWLILRDFAQSQFCVSYAPIKITRLHHMICLGRLTQQQRESLVKTGSEEFSSPVTL
jgi:hypothetical protein